MVQKAAKCRNGCSGAGSPVSVLVKGRIGSVPFVWGVRLDVILELRLRVIIEFRRRARRLRVRRVDRQAAALQVVGALMAVRVELHDFQLAAAGTSQGIDLEHPSDQGGPGEVDFPALDGLLFFRGQNRELLLLGIPNDLAADGLRFILHLLHHLRRWFDNYG